MKKKEKLSTEEKEMVDEIESYMEEVDSQPDVAESPLPPELQAKIHQQIETRALAREKAEQERMSKEERELIRLGKIYRKRRKARKYVVLAAALVAVLALGITSIGGPEKVVEKINWMLAGREQTNVDSDDDGIVQLEGVEEEEAYQQIEDKFGFFPVRIAYLPDGVEFLTAKIGDEIQGVTITYGKNGNAKVIYFIRPNYRDGSLGKDVEEEVLSDYQMKVQEVQITIKERWVEKSNEVRWSAEFAYQNVQYYFVGMDVPKGEFEKIVKNLFFS